MVYSDVWGNAPLPSRLGFWYYVTFIDDHRWGYFLTAKSLYYFSTIYQYVQTQFNKHIKILLSDSRGEYQLLRFIDQQQKVTYINTLTPIPLNRMEVLSREIYTLWKPRVSYSWIHGSLTFWKTKTFKSKFNNLPSYFNLRVFGVWMSLFCSSTFSWTNHTFHYRHRKVCSLI